MTKMLKTLAKMAWGTQIADLVAPLRDAPARLGGMVFALACPASIEGHPPFPAQPVARPATPRGGHAAPLSLPLPVTPCSLSEGNGGAK